jgi:hypothetical protein
VVLTNDGERKDLHSNRKAKDHQMEAKVIYPKLIYPKWIGGKSQIEFPKSPIKGQIFKFIDQSKEDWDVQTYFYTGSKWLKAPPTPRWRVKAITDRIRRLPNK